MFFSTSKTTASKDRIMCQPQPQPHEEDATPEEDNPSNANGYGKSSANGSGTKKPTILKDEHGYAVHSKNEQTLEAMAQGWCCGLLGTTSSSSPKSGRALGVWEKSLEDQSNIVSWFLLSYLNPMLQLGSQKILDPDDIGVPSEQDRAQIAYQRVNARWQQQLQKTKDANDRRQAKFDKKVNACKTEQERTNLLQKKKPEPLEPSLAAALFQGFGVTKLVLGVLVYLVSQLLTFVPVLILEDLVRYFQSNSSNGTHTHDTYAHPWIEVAGLLLVPFVVSLMQTRYQVLVAHAGVYVRAAVSLMLYHKSLKVSAAGRAKTSTGQVVNIMSNDSQQLQRLLIFAGMTLVAPVQIVLALTLIYRQVGNATWAGVGFMLVLAPLNAMVFGTIGKLRRKVLQYSDARVKLMNEILTGIRIIKFYAWETPFEAEVDRLRGKELKKLTQYAYFIACIFSLILSSVPFIQPILVFAVYTRWQNDPLDAGTAFTTIALFNIMRIPFAFLPMGFLQLIQSKIALRRIGRYLELPELNAYVEHTAPPDAMEQEKQVASVTIRGTFLF